MGLKNLFNLFTGQHPHNQSITEIRTLLSNKQEKYKSLKMTCPADFKALFQLPSFSKR